MPYAFWVRHARRMGCQYGLARLGRVHARTMAHARIQTALGRGLELESGPCCAACLCLGKHHYNFIKKASSSHTHTPVLRCTRKPKCGLCIRLERAPSALPSFASMTQRRIETPRPLQFECATEGSFESLGVWGLRVHTALDFR